MAPNTRQTCRSQTQTDTMDNLDVNIPNLVEEPNPFVTNAQSFALYLESISALGGCRRNNVFGPTTLTSLPTLEVTSEFAIGGTADTLNYDIQTLYTVSGIPVQVRTPHTITQIATTSSLVIPPSPMATTLFGQLLSQNELVRTQIPEGQEVEEEDEANEQLDKGDQENLCVGPGSGGTGGLGGPGGPGGSGSPRRPIFPLNNNAAEREFLQTFQAF
ncbi:hypothetical protein J3R30DRAFT_3735381 [Lentinula aciculospora]|uniref:Uncharacterized protein n=1 Tax=Lentinula aciculospora TaxID=153920 RepID=A0A9W9A7M3_9AGAR|nr:hypothetical protein J3R30DRAFT_3735381 [Lentinula aciculospora]